MPSVRISKELTQGTYFITLTVKNWYYIFDRYHRWDILAKSLEYFQNNKDLKIHAFVFMLNHIHLIVNSPDTIEFIRDFKKFTAKEILKNIKTSEPSSLKLFVESGDTHRFWEKTNFPEFIETEKFFFQKMKYIHDNPVKREYVTQAENWYWSSAHPNCALKIVDAYDEV